MSALLEVENLQTQFRSDAGNLRAVNGVSFSVNANEVLAVVGESGSGKSVTAMSIMRLLRADSAIVSGAVRMGGEDLLALPEARMRKLRGNRIGMIFQEPMSSLNPVFKVGMQIGEAVALHKPVNKAEAWSQALDMLRIVGIPAPERRMHDYPHLLSGGMRQRVMIAMALVCNPRLLIADEPTTALDVTVQAQILKLMRELTQRAGSSVILITHDFGVVAEMADRVLVMYAGRIVEEAPMRQIFARPLHPYTSGLLGAVPRLGASTRPGPRPRLNEIPGLVPNLRQELVGCAFAPRCPKAQDLCRQTTPGLAAHAEGRRVACHFPNEGAMP